MTPCVTRWSTLGLALVRSSIAATSSRTCSATIEPMTASPEPAGTIYDIGYRRYDGPRLGGEGRSARSSPPAFARLRSRRSGRSKILPWGLVVLALHPGGVAWRSASSSAIIVELYSYENYLWEIGALLPIFVAAQAPELVVNDMRHSVLPLYFSRPISRLDYVGAKLAALTWHSCRSRSCPMLLLFLGRVLAAEDMLGALGDEIGALAGDRRQRRDPRVVLASIGLAICSLAGRRAYAAGAVLAIFLIGGVVSGTFKELRGTLADDRPVHLPARDPRWDPRVALRRERWPAHRSAPRRLPSPCTARRRWRWPPCRWSVLVLRYRGVST
jgi:ABC-2 type transport system permease protein